MKLCRRSQNRHRAGERR